LTYGVANLTHLHSDSSHEHPQALEPGKTYTVKIQLDDVAYRVPKGHRLRVSISTSYWPLIWPAPTPVVLTVHTGASWVEIPTRLKVRGEKAPTFAAPEAATPVKLITVDKPWNKREVTIDQASGDMGTAGDAVVDNAKRNLPSPQLPGQTGSGQAHADNGDPVHRCRKISFKGSLGSTRPG
jgi:hypothetical protein